MTSTMSLAARICSSVAGDISPAMLQGWPSLARLIKLLIQDLAQESIALTGGDNV
jgi:hypothetical protein